MNSTPILGHEALARRRFGTRRVRDEPPFLRRGLELPEPTLPPTRAARPPRSRGVFFGASTHSRLGHRLVNALCIVLAAVGIVSVAHFAEPLLDAKFVSGNAGPALVASAMHASVLVASRPR